MKRAVLVLLVVGCGKGESRKAKEAPKDPVAKPGLVDDPTLTPAEARRELARRNTRGDQRMRATGEGSTVLEVGGAGACTHATLADVVSGAGPSLVELGFAKVKCIDGAVEVALASPGAQPVVAAVAAVPPPRGSLDERQALAKRVRGKGFTVRTTGPDETILELTAKAEGCKLSDLTDVVGASGMDYVDAGFTKMKCIGSSASVDLIDEHGAPAALVGVSATRLLADYEENEISADAKYKGRTLRVTGKIEQIARDVLGDAFVLFEGKGLGLRANFTNEGDLASLKKGRTIVVRCKGAGAPIMATLDECTLE